MQLQRNIAMSKRVEYIQVSGKDEVPIEDYNVGIWYSLNCIEIYRSS